MKALSDSVKKALLFSLVLFGVGYTCYRWGYFKAEAKIGKLLRPNAMYCADLKARLDYTSQHLAELQSTEEGRKRIFAERNEAYSKDGNECTGQPGFEEVSGSCNFEIPPETSDLTQYEHPPAFWQLCQGHFTILLKHRNPAVDK
jgi:hypothetical protein